MTMGEPFFCAPGQAGKVLVAVRGRPNFAPPFRSAVAIVGFLRARSKLCLASHRAYGVKRLGLHSALSEALVRMGCLGTADPNMECALPQRPYSWPRGNRVSTRCKRCDGEEEQECVHRAIPIRAQKE
jgi:hypothetical protein